jgi:hypothetical protein
MNATILKHVLEGDFSSFKEEMSADIDEKIKQRLVALKEKFPAFLAQEVDLSEAKDDEELEDDEDDEDGEEKKGKKKGKKDDDEDDED